MSEPFTYLMPQSSAVGDRHFETYRLTHEFYTEAQIREAHAAHCRWYAATAAQHRRDYEKMQAELNLMRWFHKGG